MTTHLHDTETTTMPATAATPVVRSVVLCTTPGAGEETVARALEDHGSGPARAWFDIRHVAPALLAQWQVSDLDEYIARLHDEHTTPHGVFSVILHWHHLRRLHRQVAGLRQPTAHKMLDIVRVIAPEPEFVRLRRADRVAHAAALHASEHEPVAAQADPAEQARNLARVEATDAVWTQWFDAIGVRPLELTYEQLTTDLVSVTSILEQPA